MTTGPLRHAPFRNMWIARTASIVGTSMVSLAMVFAVLDLGGSALDVGVVLAARVLPTGLLLLLGGVWADRFDRLRMMMGSDVSRAVLQLSVAALVFSGHATIVLLACANALLGIATAFFNPASTGTLPHTLPPDLLQQGNSLIVVSGALADIISPVVSAVALGLWSPGAVFLVDGLTFLLSAAALSRVRLPAAARRVEPVDLARDLVAGWRLMVSRTWMWTNVIAGAGYFMLVVAPFYVLGPLVGEERLGGPLSWAVLAASLSAGTVLGAVVAFTVRVRRPLAVGCLGLLVQAVPMAMFATEQSLAIIALAQLAGGAGIGYYATVWDTMVQRHVPAEARSRVSAYDWAGSLIALPIGLAIVGPAADLVGLTTVFWAAVAAVVLIVVPLVCVPGLWDLTEETEPISMAEAESV